MKSLNKIELIGNVGKDPEIRSMPNGTSVAIFNLATTDSYKKDDVWIDTTEWHSIVFFGKTADYIMQKVKKGSKIYVSGKLVSNEYEKDGQKKKVWKINAYDFMLLDFMPKTSETTYNNNTYSIPEIDNFNEDVPF